MTSDPARDVLSRWRAEVRRSIFQADPEQIEEIAQYLADRWQQLRQHADEQAADAEIHAELERWRGRTLPSPMPAARLALSWTGFGSDARASVRGLRARPMLTVGAALLSTIVVTAVVSAFVIAYGILVRPLPYPDAGRLAVLWQVHAGQQTQISYPDLADVSSAAAFDGRAAISGGRGNFRVGETIHRINLISMEAPGFALLGASPALGRLLTSDDADQPHALISHRLWTSVLNGDRGVIGRQFWLSGRHVTVVGVLQPGFDFELPVPPFFKLEKNDLWMVLDRKAPFTARRDVSGYEALVRLAPGRTLQDAQAAVDTVALRLAREHPATNAGRSFRVATLRGEVVAPFHRPLLFVSVGAGVTLIVALANLAIVGLARASAKRDEFTVRAALGATPARLWRQFYAENLLVAAAGGVWGAALAYQIVRALASSEAARLPRVDAIRFDLPAWLMVVGLVLLAAVVLTWHPVSLRPSHLRSGGRSVGRTVRRSRRLLVATEVALALALATGGALLTLSLVRLVRVDPGFDASRAAAARVAAYAERYSTRDDVTRFFDDVLGRMRARPDLSAAGASSSLPLSGQMSGTAVVAEGDPVPVGSRPTAGWEVITPGYFAAVGMRLVSGRDFVAEDRGRVRHVVIINDALARTLFPGQDPIGRRIGVGGGEASGDWHDIVGVVAGVRHTALERAPEPRVYDLFGQHWTRSMFVAARTAAEDPSHVPATIRATARAVDREAPVFEASTLQMLADQSAAPRRLASTLAIALAGASLLLALVGVYAVAAAALSERTRELGVRAALGATPRELFRLIFAEGAWSAVAGGIAGVIAASLAGAGLQSQVFGARPSDLLWLVPLVFVSVLFVLVTAVVPAARRAAAADPLVAMRAE